MADRSASDVTALLQAWAGGDSQARDRLVALALPELKRVAARCLSSRGPDRTLQATALVNEAYLRLVNIRGISWQDRAHFFALSAQLMRHILVDHARAHLYQKRGGGAQQVQLDEGLVVTPERSREIVALDDALAALEKFDQRKSRVVELRYFGGLTAEETAAVLNISAETVLRDWKLAKTWLMREVNRRGSSDTTA